MMPPPLPWLVQHRKTVEVAGWLVWCGLALWMMLEGGVW